ncbi:MAG TPA: hypothetical protein VFW04_16625 [Gemmatimonadaceae bacterium]|nr:hypothetical protein [Gemmatimonadaceae bacterium]
MRPLLVRRLPRRRVIGAIGAAIVVAACSSDAVSGPSTDRNLTLMLRFDSMANETNDDARAGALLQIAQMLAEGAPVATGATETNGSTQRMNMIAELEVTDFNGVPGDSEYTVAAWDGDRARQIVVFSVGSNVVGVLVGTAGISGEFIGTGSPTVTLGALGASCTSFLAYTPIDVEAPLPVRCDLEPASVAFGADTVHQVTYALPAQSVAGIRVEVNIPAP